ncbi:MAG TPA: ABC transporter permease [Chitinophagaceae bacterium]|nr:ABC transporter permease [Chitinophagaceae bacterium]
MFKNYFKTAIRSLTKNKVHSFINIAGLSAGMAVAIMIGLWVWDELSFDHYHTNHKRIAQVMDNVNINNEITTSDAIAIPLANELRTKFAADFKYVAVMHPPFLHSVAVGDKKLSQTGVWAQPDLPEILTLRMLRGRRDVLNDPSAILIAHSLAVALFGNTDPINKTVKVDNMMAMRIAGVYEDLPQNTTFNNISMFLPWSKAVSFMGWVNDAQTQWDNRYWKLYVELNNNVDIDAVNKIIKNIALPHIKAHNEAVFLHAMDKWHLYSEFKNGAVSGGRISYLWMFGTIGLFVLLLACINFMNLSTARSEKRAREVGIRKAVGSLRRQLVAQFLSESLAMALIAAVLAMVLVYLVLPGFNSLTQKQIHFPAASALFWLAIACFAFFTGITAGCYPALYLSSFKPVKVLKGSFKAGRFASMPRKVLVVVQFTISAALITCTIIVYTQIQYAKNRPVGYTRQGLITVTMNTPELYDMPYNRFRDALIASGAAIDMAQSSIRTTETANTGTGYDWSGKRVGLVPQIADVGVTHDFGHTIGWHVIAGRDFSRSFVADSGSIILNKTAAQLTGFKNPIGKTITWLGKSHVITGVVDDMVMESPYKPVQATIFELRYDWVNAITIRIKPEMNMHTALAKLEKVFKQINPGGPFEYKFADDEYAAKFSDEKRLGNLAAVFTLLSVFICCLGLFGLASFMAEQRTKEIGVRKVLGASSFNLWRLMSSQFIALVTIALLIAIPVSYAVMNKWLLNYAYHTNISWWVFAVTAAGALLITLLTVSYQSIKAATMNPVKSLRSE